VTGIRHACQEVCKSVHRVHTTDSDCNLAPHRFLHILPQYSICMNYRVTVNAAVPLLGKLLEKIKRFNLQKENP